MRGCSCFKGKWAKSGGITRRKRRRKKPIAEKGGRVLLAEKSQRVLLWEPETLTAEAIKGVGLRRDGLLHKSKGAKVQARKNSTKSYPLGIMQQSSWVGTLKGFI